MIMGENQVWHWDFSEDMTLSLTGTHAGDWLRNLVYTIKPAQ